MSLGPLATSAMQVGDYASARAWLEEGQTISRDMGNRFHVNHVRSELANLSRLTGDYERASELYRESLRAWQELGQLGGIARCMECLAFIAGAHGQIERAGHLFGAAEAMRDRSHLPMEPQEQAESVQNLQALRVNTDPALLDHAMESGRAFTLDQAIEYALADG